MCSYDVAEHVHVRRLRRRRLVAQIPRERNLLRRFPRFVGQRSVDRGAFGDVRDRELRPHGHRAGRGGDHGDERGDENDSETGHREHLFTD